MATGPADKLGSALRSLQATQDRGGSVGRAAADGQLEVTPKERVMVDVRVVGDLTAAVQRLKAAGMEVLATDPRSQTMVEGRLAVADLGVIAALDSVRTVSPVVGGGTDVGSVTSAGDAAHRGPVARGLGAGVTGAGVTVGVISDSIDQVGTKIAGSQATGDLPPGAQVQVVSDDTSPGASDEGRAMAEIIYDEAPGLAKLIFASGTGGPVSKAVAIDNLNALGTRVIADDIFYLSEPFFQDGQVAQAVNAARAAGVTYFASAGNRARQSWEGTYAGSGGSQSFSADATPTVQTIVTVPTGRFVQVALQWNEPWAGAVTDIDALLVKADGSALPSAPSGGQDDNRVAGGNPSEIVTWRNTSGAPVSVGLQIKRAAGTGTPFMKHIARGDFGSFRIAEAPTDSDTINPDAASAAGSIAVAAVNAGDPGLDDPESFSSRGLKTRLRSPAGALLAAPLVLQKPQMAAADAVNTSVPGFSPFFGTSAATPSAAGIAALALSAKPSLGPAQVEALMTDPTRNSDCNPLGVRPDADCGFGFAFADASVSQALDATAPAVSSTVTGRTGANGWRVEDVGVTWTVTDPESVITDRAGCAAATIRTDTVGTDLFCAPASIGGVARSVVTVKRDTVPPTVPTFGGIAAATYTPSTVPAAAAVSCGATDATSGVAGCTVAGYDAALGAHVLSATATDNAGLTSTTTLTYVVDAAPPTPTPPVPPATVPSRTAPPAILRRSPPVLSAFTGPAAARAGKPVAFSVTLDRDAGVTFTLSRRASGRKVRGKCVAPARRNRRASRCTRLTTIGSFTAALTVGSQKATFSGRLKGRALTPGSYRITAVPRGADGRPGGPAARSFVVRR